MSFWWTLPRPLRITSDSVTEIIWIWIGVDIEFYFFHNIRLSGINNVSKKFSPQYLLNDWMIGGAAWRENRFVSKIVRYLHRPWGKTRGYSWSICHKNLWFSVSQECHNTRYRKIQKIFLQSFFIPSLDSFSYCENDQLCCVAHGLQLTWISTSNAHHIYSSPYT